MPISTQAPPTIDAHIKARAFTLVWCIWFAYLTGTGASPVLYHTLHFYKMFFSKIRNVLICDGVDPICGNILSENGANVTCQAKFTLETLLKEIEVCRQHFENSEILLHVEFDNFAPFFKCFFFLWVQKYDALIVRSATKVTEEVICAGINLKLIGRAGTGIDNIDCNAATRRGIIVMKYVFLPFAF